MDKVLQMLLELEKSDREECIKAVPKLLIKISKFRKIAIELKEAEKMLKEMVNRIGTCEDDYFTITEAIEKTTSVEYKKLEEALALVSNQIETLEEQKMMLELKKNIQADIEVKKPGEKLKLLARLNPELAESIKQIKIKKSFLLTPNEENLNNLEERIKHRVA